MSKYIGRIKQVAMLIKAGHFVDLIKALKHRFWSEKTYVGLRRDVTKPHETPDAKIPLNVRRAEDADIVKIQEENDPAVVARLRWFSENIGTCYMALNEDNDPCSMQFLLRSKDNDILQSYFGKAFPRLAPDEALVEAVFTVDRCRGMGVLPYAVSQIVDKAVISQATKVVTFVEESNIPALKGFKRAGFGPYLTRHEKWRFFFKKTSFNSLPPGSSFSFD